jgi:hypothetical protein
VPFALCGVVAAAAGAGQPAAGKVDRESVDGVHQMIASRQDVWAQAAIRQPDGPSYEFFARLLPPLRYVNSEFRHYPIVLSAPQAPVKARWISDGRAVNARANKKPMWREIGTPIHFFVGESDEPFGADRSRVEGPMYVDGFLPVVRIAYRQGSTTYEQEAFAPVGESVPNAQGQVRVRFQARHSSGIITARLGSDAPLTATDSFIGDESGNAIVGYGPEWEWRPNQRELQARLEVDRAAELAIFSQPVAGPAKRSDYDAERRACIDAWTNILGRGARLSVPESRVNDAWRALVIGNLTIAVGDRMHYSAGNAYDRLYEAECGDAVRSLLLYGQTDVGRRMIRPLLEFNRHATRFHVAGHKLQLLSDAYWLTRDAALVREHEHLWMPVVQFILSSRQRSTGLLPRENYAGDVNQQVVSLSSNANCWRGLRNLAAVLDELGERVQAAKLAAETASFRAAILTAVDNCQNRNTRPPFIPNALDGAEPAHDPLTATRLGSYYDLMAPYILGSGVFGVASERENWMIEYLRQHGGLAMGMIRTMPHQGEFKGEPGVNVLYGLRYMLALLRRDDRDHALAGFYGQLAQGMTRDTYIGAEGTRFVHGDESGRSMYLPPNSASNAMFLATVRYLLVQDWDLDDDGRPDTLRLLFAAPGRWLRDGAVIDLQNVPTMFGPVSLHAASRLCEGSVRLTVHPPPQSPKRVLLRTNLPHGWSAVGAFVNDRAAPLAQDGSVDLSAFSDRFDVKIAVRRRGQSESEPARSCPTARSSR